MAYKLQKKKELRTKKQQDWALKPRKTTGYGVFLVQEFQILICAHARNQICQTTSEMEEKLSFDAADEVIVVGPGLEQTGAKLRHHCLENTWEWMGYSELDYQLIVDIKFGPLQSKIVGSTPANACSYVLVWLT